MGCSVLLLATVETKHEAITYFRDAMAKHDVHCHVLDLSLKSNGEVWSGERKLQTMAHVANTASLLAQEAIGSGATAAVAIGGGTGGEIALQVMRNLPFAYPKMLITTLPFDPRFAVADNAITIVPTLADICGLNAALRQVLENAAAMLAGLCNTATKLAHVSTNPSVGITALGATGAAVEALVDELAAVGEEATVFHANGFGGAAYARFARCGTFHSVVDLTCHELTRIHIAGASVDMPDRFTAARDNGVPQVILPGGVNFIGLGELALVPEHYRKRPLYQHTSHFTHVQITEVEMAMVAGKLAQAVNGASAPVDIIVPMGGFSHQDAPGHAIESQTLREVFLRTIRAEVKPSITVEAIDHHISAPQTTRVILDALTPHLAAFKGNDNVPLKA